nr:unnamed protein product [Callosobruchus analis]
MPFDLPNPDGCKDSGLTCPIKAGQTYTYIAALPISSKYPRVSSRPLLIIKFIF